jgi:hypothetical protein
VELGQHLPLPLILEVKAEAVVQYQCRMMVEQVHQDTKELLDFIDIGIVTHRDGKVRIIASNVEFNREGDFRLQFLLQKGTMKGKWHHLVSHTIKVDQKAASIPAGMYTRKAFCLTPMLIV